MNPISNVARHVKLYGWRSTLEATARKVRLALGSMKADGDALPFRFTTHPPDFHCRDYVPCTPGTAPRINFVVPWFGRGAGGIGTIFRLASYLEVAGFDVAFYLFGPSDYATDREATAAMRAYFLPLRATVYVGVERMRSAEVCVATCWESAYPVRDFQGARKKAYVVMDYEPAFFPAGAAAMLADATYGFGFHAVCVGAWLAEMLSERGQRVTSFRLAFDEKVYTPNLTATSRKRVVAYARHTTPRRAVPLLLLALEMVAERRPSAEIVLFADDGLPRLPFPHTRSGYLNPVGLAELYRSASVGVCLSATNYSLVPQEMLACGLPVVDINHPSLCMEYSPRGLALQLASPTPHNLARAISSVLEQGRDAEIATRTAARQLVADRTWDEAGRVVVEAFCDLAT
jgi:glycosyltransferase involved in cell wall biosynthesis